MSGSISFALILVAIGALAFAGLLAAGETALNLISRSRAESLAESDPRPATRRLVLLLHDLPVVMAAAVFVRVTLEMVAAVIFTLVYAQFQDAWWAAGLLGLLTSALASFILTGVSPRTRGRKAPEQTALRAAFALRVVYLWFGGVSRLLVHIGQSVTPGGKVGGGPFASDVHLRQIVEIASENEAIEDDEAEMIQSVVQFGNTPVRQVMVDRTRMVTIGAEATLRQAIRLFNRSGHSRLPVIGEDVDDLRGLLYLKDILRALYSGSPVAETSPVTAHMRAPQFVPDSSAIDSVLDRMRQAAVHVVIVVDEYGGVAGLATIEDLIEEIIGEISDEHDHGEQDQPQEVEPGVWVVPAHMNVSDAGELLDLEIEDEDVDSVGGLLGKTIGLVPVPGAETVAAGMHILALESAGRRKTLHKVQIWREASPQGDDPDEASDVKVALPGGRESEPAPTDGDDEAGTAPRKGKSA
ncbi:HlyC/CorC family transporter [Micrococcales bacterium 31B]|nr:HlyC/CorC family transporter [Micrococcales bacterium 31B]